ncbi:MULTISPECIES: hypothetical protein [unclassified Streptomyces]|uniref:hypothetical protein n=1 Tax=unclassified Streptomyces TaxID=2593676 RepID=UPI003663B5E2
MSTSPGPERLCGYAVVANVRREIPYGPGGAELRSGTKHFPAGGKVWLAPPCWDLGFGEALAVGRHRGSPRLAGVVTRVVHLENFRVRAVYSPDLCRRLETYPGTGLWSAREDAEAQAAGWSTGKDLYRTAGGDRRGPSAGASG